MARYLKRGMDASAIKAADAKVRATVEQILEQIETGGDAAVRELSQQFDNWSPPSFKLAASEVERAISQVAKRDLDDIKFAQAQVRNFAQKQKETHARPGGRDAARRGARPQPHPGEFDRLLRAGRALSHGRLGPHVDRHRARRGGEAHRRLRTAVQGRPASRHRCRHAFRRRRRHLRARRRAGSRRHGARHRDDPCRRHDRRARQRLCGGSQAPALRPRRHRSARGPDRNAGHRRRQRGRRALRHRSPRSGRARPDLAGHPHHQFGEAGARHHARDRAAARRSFPPPTPRGRPGPTSAR